MFFELIKCWTVFYWNQIEIWCWESFEWNQQELTQLILFPAKPLEAWRKKYLKFIFSAGVEI